MSVESNVRANATPKTFGPVARRHPLRSSAPRRSSTGTTLRSTSFRRLLQSHGAEVVHLGHNRSVADIVAPPSRKTRMHRLQFVPGRTQ
jgi:methylmalonyl-CoA mutase